MHVPTESLQPPLFRSRPCASRAGLTLIELALASSVVLVAILGALGAVTSSSDLTSSTRETTTALAAAQMMMERLHGTPCEEVWARYNDIAGDDLDGAGTTTGFAVDGLDPQDGDADGLVGRIVLPAPAGPLTETFVDASLGMPRDLNADGAVDGNDHSGDYVVLPVRVLIEWRGSSGDRSLELSGLLGVRE